MRRRNRTSRYTNGVNFKCEDWMIGAIKQYMEDFGLTKSEALREIVADGINFGYNYKEDNEEPRTEP